jgi:hypothetical protein
MQQRLPRAREQSLGVVIERSSLRNTTTNADRNLGTRHAHIGIASGHGSFVGRKRAAERWWSRISRFRQAGHSRHRSIAMLMTYVDEHDRQKTQTTLADLVASTVATS